MNKILIVDDNDQIIKLLSLFFKDKYELVVANSGQTAINIWRKEKPDIIILDIMLPDFSGYEVCAIAKSDITLKDIPIIFLSAKSGHDAREKGYKLGAVNYIEKPFRKGELLAIVKSTLKMVKVTHEQYKILEVEDIVLNTDTYEAYLQGNQVELTNQEFKILYAFLIKKDRVISREDILIAIGKEGDDVSDRTIDSHISHIRKKIMKSILKIKAVYGTGYKIVSVKS